MITKRAKRVLMDKLHRGFVWTMLGITVLGLGGISVNMYTIIQNAKQQEKLMLAGLETKEDPEEFPTARVPRTSFH